MKFLSRRRILLLLLVPASLMLLLAAAEVFFRIAVRAPDLPGLVYSDGVLRHSPGRRGVYWSRDVRAPFSINAQGWNSARPGYPAGRTAAARIALVGGALVEALQVPPQRSMGEDMERALPGTEVFRYGLAGAPLSQDLQMARRAALPAHPDVLVVLLAAEDIEASYRDVPGVPAKSFLKLRLDAADEVQELPPGPYAPTLAERLGDASATWRYLAWGRRLRFAALRRVFQPSQDRRFEAAGNATDAASREALDRRAARYLFSRLKAESAASGTRLLLVMDAPRGAIEAGDQPDPRGPYRENRLAAQEAANLGIPFLDLTAAFSADFQKHRRVFSFAGDSHWNGHAHAVAARAVVAELRRLGWTRWLLHLRR